MEPSTYRLRLSIMMFGVYLILGSWSVTLATYLISSPLLGGLLFSAKYVSWVYNTWAFGGLVAPVFIGLLADRLFPAQRLLAIFSFTGAAIMVTVAFWCEREQHKIETLYRESVAAIQIDGRPMLEVQEQLLRDPTSLDENRKRELMDKQHEIRELPALSEAIDHAFYPLLGMMFAYSFCTLMTIGCSNVIGFRNLKDPQKHYGQIRLFGTVGWIIAGIAIALTGRSISHFPLFFVAGMSVLMGCYYLTLPHTPPLGHGKTLGEAFGLPALKLFRQRSFRILISSVFMMSMVQQFFSVYANKFLTDLKAPKPTAMQTLAQVSEVICMALLPGIVDRWGLRKTMLVGIACWTVRNALFATNSMPVVCLAGLPLHGFSFTFFFLTAMIYVDRQAPRELRASTQGIFTFTSSGLGVLSGNMLAATIIDINTHGETIDWQPFWIVPMAMSAGVFGYFAIGFHPKLDQIHVQDGEASRHLVENMEELAGSN